MFHSLKMCIVHHSDAQTAGLLFIENERVVVLLNHLVEKADLGPLKHFRDKHIEPEASIVVIPRNLVTDIQIL